jgi:ankyrin repeat protein
MVRNRQEIARFLIGRGCKTDLLMAAALGDTDLAERLLQADPECIRTRVSSEYFPMIGEGDAKGGTIYQWELGWYVSAPQVAKRFGHTALFDMLMARCPPEERLLNACWMHDEAMVHSLLAENPKLADALPPAGRRHVAHAARDNDTIAARLMLEAGLPVVDQYSQHHATALHWTGFNGNAELARLILKYNPALEDTDNQYQSTPLNWAMYGSVNGWHPEAGDYAGVVEALLDAGAHLPKQVSGSKAVRAVFRKRRTK